MITIAAPKTVSTPTTAGSTRPHLSSPILRPHFMVSRVRVIMRPRQAGVRLRKHAHRTWVISYVLEGRSRTATPWHRLRIKRAKCRHEPGRGVRTAR